MGNKESCFNNVHVSVSNLNSISVVQGPSKKHAWPIEVSLKDKYKKGQPFNGLHSKIVTATILTYFGYRNEVHELL